GLSGCGLCPAAAAGAGGAGVAVGEAGVAGTCALSSGGALVVAGGFCSAGAGAGGAVWPISNPASDRNTSGSRMMRDFIGVICLELISSIIACGPMLDE